MAFSRSGQTSVEYLIILAVVLVIALVAIGLSLFFAQSSGDVLQSETITYWSTQVPPPFRILDMQGYYYSGNPSLGEVALVIQNIDDKPAYLRNLLPEPNTGSSFHIYGNHSTDGSIVSCCQLDPSGAGPGVAYGSQMNISFAPSQTMTIYMRLPFACSSSGSTAYDSTSSFYQNLTIYYDTPYFTQLSFKGVKPIQGRCNPT